jgi:molecular chaperone HtpG
MRATRILELNADHAAFKALQKAYAEDKDRAKDMCRVLLAQSMLIAGLPLEDPSAYTELVCKLF